MAARTAWFASALLVGMATAAMAESPTGFSSELETVAQAGPEEKVAYVGSAVNEIQGSLVAIGSLAETAQASGDTKAIQCVSKKQTDVKAMADASERAEGKMLEYAGGGPEFESHLGHEFRMVAIALQRTRMLLAEAERCVGGQELVDGQTSVQIMGYDDANPFEFTDWLSVGDTDVGFDPPDLSPFR